MEEFKYLGRSIRADNDDWGEATNNIQRARQRWGMIKRILTRDGADKKMMKRFYMAIIQAILLYGSETWTMTVAIIRRMETFHNRIIRHIAGEHIRPGRNNDDDWEYPDMEEMRKRMDIRQILEYINQRREKLWEKQREESRLANNLYRAYQN